MESVQHGIDANKMLGWCRRRRQRKLISFLQTGVPWAVKCSRARARAGLSTDVVDAFDFTPIFAPCEVSEVAPGTYDCLCPGHVMLSNGSGPTSALSWFRLLPDSTVEYATAQWTHDWDEWKAGCATIVGVGFVKWPTNEPTWKFVDDMKSERDPVDELFAGWKRWLSTAASC